MDLNVALDLSHSIKAQSFEPGYEVVVRTFDVATAHEKCRRVACSTTEQGDVVVGCL